MGGVIKSGSPVSQEGGTQSIVFNLEDMTERANNYLEEVRKQAATLLAEARQQASHVTEAARQEGQAAALREAEEKLESKLTDQLATLLPAMETLTHEMQHAKESWLRHWETQTVQLALAIAARVIRREVRQQPEITVDWVQEALTLALGGGMATVHLHPNDHAGLKDRLQKLTHGMQDLGEVNFVADPQMSPGGCRVTTQFGEVDQQMESQLARIEAELSG